jgi:hypothetical protein
VVLVKNHDTQSHHTTEEHMSTLGAKHCGVGKDFANIEIRDVSQ